MVHGGGHAENTSRRVHSQFVLTYPQTYRDRTVILQERPHLEVALVTYGGDRTENALWSGGNAPEYAGIYVVTVRHYQFPCL